MKTSIWSLLGALLAAAGTIAAFDGGWSWLITAGCITLLFFEALGVQAILERSNRVQLPQDHNDV